MTNTIKILTLLSLLWTILALIVQWVQARGTGRKDFSVKSGDVIRGIIYNFTWAMLPNHKETIRLHPVKFLIGVIMHIGIFIAIAEVIVVLLLPQSKPLFPSVIGTILAAAALCGIYLFVRRIFSITLRAMSSPDDYISILLTLGFLLTALAHEFGILNSTIFLIYSIVLFLYFPLGKLRHAMFFFVARTDYGARMGYRGTYPARSEAGK